MSGDGWWVSFRDPQLSEYTEQALGGNLELRSFVDRIQQANAVVRQGRAGLFPAIAADGEYQATWMDRRTESSDIGVLMDWEVDIWGRLRARAKSFRKLRDASVEEWMGARLLLSSAVGEAYFDVLAANQQLRLIDEQIELNETLLDLTKNRFGQGQNSIVDVLQQQQQLEATKTFRPDFEASVEQSRYALDVLLGREPGKRLEMSASNLMEPPAMPAGGIPPDLVVSRPDLRAFQDRIASLDYDVWEAIADRLPRISISGTLATSGTPSVDSLVGDLSGNLLGPVFEAGARKAEVNRRRARLEEEIHLFADGYLRAVQEVKSAVVVEQKQAEKIALQEQQLTTARKLLRESTNRYSQGLTDYLPVLDAVSTVQTLERQIITSRRSLLSARIALHRAIGGPMPEISRP